PSISPLCHREEPLCRIGRPIAAEFGTSVILSGLAEDDRSALLQRFVAQVEATLRPSRETSTTGSMFPVLNRNAGPMSAGRCCRIVAGSFSDLSFLLG